MKGLPCRFTVPPKRNSDESDSFSFRYFMFKNIQFHVLLYGLVGIFGGHVVMPFLLERMNKRNDKNIFILLVT